MSYRKKNLILPIFARNIFIMPHQHIRVRFAPSPTGPLHIGGLRTALFNYLFAKKVDGDFILRIEDTDQTRFVPGAEEYILESLEWCGIIPDEGGGRGGNYAPYRQSDRKEIYKAYAEDLVRKGFAYYAFDTPEELERLRKEAEMRKESFTYNQAVRGRLNNSITLDEHEVRQLHQNDVPYVIRFKFPEDEDILMQDEIRGNVRVLSSTMDDKILFKSDGMPTYHLANVVDDYLMKISHVIRGEEWLPSLPLHVSLYKAFGWEENMPRFAHLPLILKPDGKGKLSKRDGDKGGFPVFPLEWKDPVTGEVSPGYRESGYFPEACVNILAFLGWNPGTEQEIYTMDELIRDFDLAKVGKSGSKFDPAKARWYNHHYLQQKPDRELVPAFQEILREKSVVKEDGFVERVIGLVKERADFVQDLWDHADFFFIAPVEYDEKVVRKRWKEGTGQIISSLAVELESCHPFEAEIIGSMVRSWIEKHELETGVVMNAWRLALVGTSKGPGLQDIAALLGKEETVSRMNNAVKTLG